MRLVRTKRKEGATMMIHLIDGERKNGKLQQRNLPLVERKDVTTTIAPVKLIPTTIRTKSLQRDIVKVLMNCHR